MKKIKKHRLKAILITPLVTLQLVLSYKYTYL